MKPFKALDLLVATAPKVQGRAPYWRPRPAEIDVTALIEPAWADARPWAPGEREGVVVLDAIGAYLSSASSVEVAHGPLERVKRAELDRNAVGYWLVDLPPWHSHPLPPPWGSRVLPDGPVWISAPTMRSIIDLAQGEPPACDLPVVHDAWLGRTRCRLRSWAEKVQAARVDAIQERHAERYEAIKTGYSQAVTIMETGDKSVVHRPDWAHAIRAQHAANLWWKAWKACRHGLYPLGMLAVDEVAFTRRDANRVLFWRGDQGPAPFLIDRKGHRLGAFRPKAILTPEQWETIAAKHIRPGQGVTR